MIRLTLNVGKGGLRQRMDTNKAQKETRTRKGLRIPPQAECLKCLLVKVSLSQSAGVLRNDLCLICGHGWQGKAADSSLPCFSKEN